MKITRGLRPKDLNSKTSKRRETNVMQSSDSKRDTLRGSLRTEWSATRFALCVAALACSAFPLAMISESYILTKVLPSHVPPHMC